MLSTFIKLPFVFKAFALSIFEWSLKTGFTIFVDDSDQSSDGGSRGPSREVSVERDESRETSLERRPSLQLASSRASLVETSHSE